MAQTVCPHGCGKVWDSSSNRTASQPLDSDCVKQADQECFANCERLKQPDGSYRQLTMESHDACCRRVWMDAYLAAVDRKNGVLPPDDSDDDVEVDDPKTPPDDSVLPCEKANLVVRVIDFDDEPIMDAIVDVVGLGRKVTDVNGTADYGYVNPDTYEVWAEKEEHSPAEDRSEPPGPAYAQDYAPACATTIITLQLQPPLEVLRENLIIIGTEVHYDSFWWKMMCVAPAYLSAVNGQHFRSADRKTVAYCDFGYTHDEKLRIDDLKNLAGCDVVAFGSVADLMAILNNRRETTTQITRLQDVVIFSHGLPGYISFNYDNSPDVDYTIADVRATRNDAFVPGGRIYSYACRTGNSTIWENFNNDAEAHPENSLAQVMADHFQVEVHAFLTRSAYTQVLRDPAQSATIASTLKTARATQGGSLIQIPPEHEALPHPGLATGWGAWREGTNEYALWRKAGGRQMPGSHSTPTGLTPGLHRFTPR